MSNIRFKGKSKKRMGLYAQYSKIDGELVQTKEMSNHQAYNSNKDCLDKFWDLITEKDNYQDYDVSLIRLKSTNWSNDDIIEFAKKYYPEMYECEICDEYFSRDEMYQIEDEDEGVFMSVCKKCNSCNDFNKE